MPAERRLYVYFRLPESELAAYLSAAERLRLDLAASEPRWRCRFERRPETTHGDVTVMECHTAEGGIDEALEAAIEAAAARHFGGLRCGPRHLERFVPLAP